MISLIGIPFALAAVAMCFALLAIASEAIAISLGDWALKKWGAE